MFIDTDWRDRANRVIAHGALTNSKRETSFVKGVYPTHITRGTGAFLYTTKNKRFVDYICGLGSVSLGYANSFISESIARHVSLGITHSLPSIYEVQLAERIKEVLTYLETFRFFKTGTEACMASLRAARAYTGRTHVYSEGYHGWSDPFVSLTTPHNGVPDDKNISTLNDISEIDTHVAAVILEPVQTDWSPKRKEWLQRLRQKCTEKGVVLIFDEIITGFRFKNYTVAKYMDVLPDLSCFGKGLGNGMPVSVLAGNRDIMGADYFASGTFCGESLSLVVATKLIELLQTKYKIDSLWDKGLKFLNEINKLCPQKIEFVGYPTRSTIKGDALQKALFFQEHCLSYNLIGPSFFVNYSNSEFLDNFVSISKDILNKLETTSIKGDMPSSPFAQRQRGG